MPEERKKLTKSQRRRENERSRKRKQEFFEAEIGPKPAYLTDTVIEPNITDDLLRQMRSQLSAEERAPAHLVDYNETPTFKADQVGKLARAGGKAMAASAEEDRRDAMRRFGGQWGKRGQAKIIAHSMGVSVRTIQRWLKKEKKRQT